MRVGARWQAQAPLGISFIDKVVDLLSVQPVSMGEPGKHPAKPFKYEGGQNPKRTETPGRKNFSRNAVRVGKSREQNVGVKHYAQG